MSESKVVMFDDSDPAVQRAYLNARASFRYFWREMSWERRRIIPSLDLACVKAPFSDGSEPRNDGNPDVEQMWCNEVDFDGRHISGVLLNEPNWLRSVHAGDRVRLTIPQITDWMYVIRGEVFGAFTVNALRAQMNSRERREHDEAWGLDFGDPHQIRVVPQPKTGGGLLKSWFGKQPADSGEHPMSVNMAASLSQQLAKNPHMLHDASDEGWTLLHQEALAGSAPTVKVLLAAGANRHAKTNDGRTALDLAHSLGWENVATLLTS